MADFPQGRLELLMWMAFGADLTANPGSWTWTEVSADLLDQQIVINHGRANESAQATPASMSFALDNPHGHYTPDNPMSDHWPNIVLGTPCRAGFQMEDPYLYLDGDSAGYVSTPDTAALDITGDIDIRAEASIAWYAADNQVLIAKWESTGNQRSYALRILNGSLILNWSTDGTPTNSAFVTLPALPERAALRATLDVNNGAAGRTIRMYWAESIAGPWTQIGDDIVQAGTTSIFASTAPLRVGGPDATTDPPRVPFTGRGHAFEVRDGIAGTVVASPDFTAQPSGTTSFADSAGRTWTLNGTAEITDREYRFVGNIDEMLPTWPYGDLSHDDDPGESRVTITASGILRRLGQGEKALDSTLRRRIPSFSPVAYWPMEEDRDAAQAYSPVQGVSPLAVTGLDFAALDTLPGSSPLPQLEAAASLSGAVPTAADGEWQIEFVYYLETLPGTLTTMLQLATTGTARTVRLQVATNNVRLEGLDAGAVQVFLVNITAPEFTGAWNRLQIRFSTSGSTISANVRWVTIGGGGSSSTDTFTGTAGHVTQVSSPFGSGLAGMGIGHLTVFGELSDDPFNSADQAFNGERAAARLQRLCGEESIPFWLLGPPGDTMQMGPQRPGKLLDILNECAETDGGILGEQRALSGLQYRPRTTLYNQPVALTFDAALNEIVNPFAPVLDDQRKRNDTQVSRTAGSSARTVDDASIAASGLYAEQVTVNAYADTQLPQMAAWRLHLGTWPGMRYPSVSSELAIAPQLIEAWLAVDSGARVQVVNLPPQHPTDAVDLLVQGYKETLSPVRWSITSNCTPAGPWTVAVADDTGARADTSGSELAAAVTASDTVLSVTTTAGPIWTTDLPQFPFDVRLGGEVVTVSLITGLVQDTFSRTVATGWGTATSGHVWTTTGGSAADYSVQGV